MEFFELKITHGRVEIGINWMPAMKNRNYKSQGLAVPNHEINWTFEEITESPQRLGKSMYPLVEAHWYVELKDSKLAISISSTLFGTSAILRDSRLSRLLYIKSASFTVATNVGMYTFNSQS